MMRSPDTCEVVRRVASPFVSAGALLSFSLFAVAAAAYPGGSHFDHAASGHDFWRNSLCDVARTTAIGGGANDLGSALARTAMTLMALAVGALFWLLPESFPSRARLGAVVRVLGTIATPAMVAVVFLPTDRFGALHGIAIVAAGVPGLGAALIAVAALLAERARARVASGLGVATLMVALAAFTIYVHELVAGGPPRVLVPALEHVAALLLIAWMLAVAWSLRRRRAEHRAADVHRVHS